MIDSEFAGHFWVIVGRDNIMCHVVAVQHFHLVNDSVVIKDLIVNAKPRLFPTVNHRQSTKPNSVVVGDI